MISNISIFFMVILARNRSFQKVEICKLYYHKHRRHWKRRPINGIQWAAAIRMRAILISLNSFPIVPMLELLVLSRTLLTDRTSGIAESVIAVIQRTRNKATVRN